LRLCLSGCALSVTRIGRFVADKRYKPLITQFNVPKTPANQGCELESLRVVRRPESPRRHQTESGATKAIQLTGRPTENPRAGGSIPPLATTPTR
jgi:hypothetical protein